MYDYNNPSERARSRIQGYARISRNLIVPRLVQLPPPPPPSPIIKDVFIGYQFNGNGSIFEPFDVSVKSFGGSVFDNPKPFGVSGSVFDNPNIFDSTTIFPLTFPFDLDGSI